MTAPSLRPPATGDAPVHVRASRCEYRTDCRRWHTGVSPRKLRLVLAVVLPNAACAVARHAIDTDCFATCINGRDPLPAWTIATSIARNAIVNPIMTP
jgi:hypothetical protein